MTADRDDLLTRAEAAKLLGLTVWGVGYYRRERANYRALPIVKYKGRRYIPKSAVLAFKAERDQVQAVS